MDALALKDLPEVFDNVIDSGLSHVFGDEAGGGTSRGWRRP